MRCFLSALLVFSFYYLPAQYTFFSPSEAYAIEVSAENTALLRLPAYRNAISSLAVAGDLVVGATTASNGSSPFIFVASLSKREMITSFDVAQVVQGQRAVRSGLCKKSDRIMYAGTLPNDSKSGGHILEITIDGNGKIKATDLGMPVTGEGIFTMIINKSKTKLYGITYPSGRFFCYDINTRKTDVYNEISPSGKMIRTYDEFSLLPEQYLCKALIEDNNGVIYGSSPINKLFYFDPANKKFTFFADIPDVWGRNVLGQVEAWAKSKDGRLFGGNSGDGQLFTIDPSTKKVRNLGKPVMMNRLRGLTFGADGKLYGIAGAHPGYVHLFSYDAIDGFRDLGNPQFTMKAPGIEQGIDWRGFQLGTITASADGKYIIMGEDETLSHLMVFPVSSK